MEELRYILEAARMLLEGDAWWQIGLVGVLWLSAVIIVLSYAVGKLLITVRKANDIIKELLAKKEPKDFTSHIFLDVDISAILRNIKHDMHADRVTIYQYHDGETDIADNHFLKFSCTHETLSYGSMSAQKRMKNIPTAMFGHLNRDIFQGEVVEIPVLNDLSKDGELMPAHQLLSANNVTSFYMFPLVTPLGKTFGFGTVEYCCEPTLLDEQWIAWAENRFTAAGTLLSGAVLEHK